MTSDGEQLISIAEAAAMGVERVRQPIWANPLDHLKIDIVGGKPGPWLHLFCPMNKACNGRDPVDILGIRITGQMTIDPLLWEFVPYTGPLPDSEEYRAAAARFAKQETERGGAP